MKKTPILLLLLLIVHLSLGQNAITIVGGDITGSDGSLSFSGGEVAVRHSEARAITVVNITEYFTEGVQQAFAGSVNDIEDALPFYVSIYPNPTSNRLMVSTDQLSVNLSYTLFNLQGQTLLSGVAEGGNADIDLSKLPVGSYLLRLYNGSDSSKSNVYKIIKAL